MKAQLGFDPAAGGVLDSNAAHALWAQTYDDGLNPLLVLEERCLEPLIPGLKGRRVLDLACGTGRWLKRLLEREPCLAVGLDVSQEMLKVASAKTQLNGRLARANVLALPIRDRCVDFAVCSFAMSYIADLSEVARELARVLTQGADIFISDFHPSGHQRGWRRSFRVHDRVIEIASVVRPLEEIHETFAHTGFRMVAEFEPSLEESERNVFERAGKLSQFNSVRFFPAIFILHLQYTGRPGILGQ